MVSSVISLFPLDSCNLNLVTSPSNKQPVIKAYKSLCIVSEFPELPIFDIGSLVALTQLSNV